jgi:hypothetical protein
MRRFGLRNGSGLATHDNFVGEHSHAVTPAHFVGPGLCCAKPLFGRPKRRQTIGLQQPKLYAQLPKNSLKNQKNRKIY